MVAALRRDLRKLPEELRDCTEAAAALELARSIDQGLQVAVASRQLAALLVSLRSRGQALTAVRPSAPADAQSDEPKGAGIGDLTARIAARRDASTG